jgi:methionyl-tRNA formyltransferase
MDTKKIKIIFFGTPEYVLPILDKLHKEYEVVAVVTQEPKPVGRDQKLSYSHVDEYAHKHKMHKQFDFDDLPEADLGVCASFGKIIPEFIINNLKFGILNIHPSLLPKYRGSSPIQASMIEGGGEIGVSIIKMNNKLDQGSILTQFKDEILETDDNETLRNRLFEKASDVLVEMIPNYIKGKITQKRQNEEEAIITKEIKKDDAYLPFEVLKEVMTLNAGAVEIEFPFVKNQKYKVTAKLINNFIKAMKPWPYVWTKVRIKNDELRMKILKTHINPETGYLELDEVQLEGKNVVSFKQFNENYKLV